jgi:hypothetical protein
MKPAVEEGSCPVACIIHELPRETVRKAPIASRLKPQKPTKRVEEVPFRCSEPIQIEALEAA